MKYLIMCGGKYTEFETPRHLIKVNGEELVARTIRLLCENNVTKEDIWITSNNPVFDKFGLTRKTNENNKYESDGHHPNDVGGFWVDALYPMDEPCCYLFGDVFYSDAAIKTIVNTEITQNTMFGNVPGAPGCKKYLKKWAEPLAFKIVDNDELEKVKLELKKMWLRRDPRLIRHPIAWEVYAQMYGIAFSTIEIAKSKFFININDYSTDVDHPEDAQVIEDYLRTGKLPYANSNRKLKIDEYLKVVDTKKTKSTAVKTPSKKSNIEDGIDTLDNWLK